MKRAIAFLLLAFAGVALLLHYGGGLRTSRHEEVSATLRPATQERTPRTIAEGHTLPVPSVPVRVPAAHGVMVPAEAEALVWQDRATGETVEIPFFFRWRFTTQEVRGVQPEDAERQGALCIEPVLEIFRDPQSREEALALRGGEAGAQDALLSHRFAASEAQALGHLAQRLEKRTQGGGQASAREGLPDSTVRLRGRVRVLDLQRGIEIDAQDLTVYPREERAEGSGTITLRHAAFVLDGEGLSIDRDSDRGWNRIELHRKVVLRLREQAVGADGEPIVRFVQGGLRPSHVTADGRALILHERGRREQNLRVRFTDGVRVEENAGGSLDARNLALDLFRPDHALAPAAAASQWRLREMVADGDVRLAWPATQQGMGGLRSARTDRLVHLMPQDESPTTTLEGRSTFILEGQDLLGGVTGDTTARLRVMCHERAWMGPAPPGTLDLGLDAGRLRRLMLRGDARIEHQALDGDPAADMLEAQEIDFLLYDTADASPGATTRSVPVRFAATGSVRLGGPRIRGQMHRLVAENLHTERPVAFAEGPDTEIYFLAIGDQERLLGSRQGAPGRSEMEPTPSWRLERLLARGGVRVDTSLGGPSLGAPVRVTCQEAGYERSTGLARLSGSAGAPARVTSLTPDGRDNLVQADLMTLDRAHGILTARGSVRGELHLAWDPGQGARPEPLLPRSAPGVASELGVRTSARIEIAMSRASGETGPALGVAQVLRINGPLRAEMHGPLNTNDVLLADSLEVSMVYDHPAGAQDAGPTAPLARATSRRAAPTPVDRPRTPSPASRRVELDAAEVRVDLGNGEVSSMRAYGGVVLTMEADRIEGESVAYDSQTRRVRVDASAGDWRRRPATLRFGAGAAHSEALAQQLEVLFDETGVGNIRLSVPNGDTGQLDVRLESQRTQGEVEWYSFTFWGEIRGDSSRIETQRVRVARRLRAAGATSWSPPLALWSDVSWIEGRNLLRSQGREILRAVAEGEQVTLQTGEPGDRVWAWGQRFAYEAASGRARLTSRPGEDVTIQREGREKNFTLVIEVDMQSGLPVFMDGPRIIWGPAQGR